MITFKAKFINNAYIKINNGNQRYRDYKVSFVQLDTNSREDLRAIKETNIMWDNRHTLANSLYGHFHYCWLKNNSENLSFYALTKQRNNFERLDSEDILGLAQVYDRESGTVNLQYLQADPNNNFFSFEPRFKNIGSAMVYSLEQIFSKTKEEIILIPLKNVEAFYEKLGFKWDDSVLVKKF